MTFTLVTAPAATVLKFKGEFDLSNAADVEAALEVAIESDDPLIIADLSEMTFAGTTMMRSLVAGRTAAVSHGSTFVLIRPTPIVWHAFEVMGLDEMFEAFDDVDGALAAHHAG